MTKQNILAKICDDKLSHIEKNKSQTSEAELLDLIASNNKQCKGFIESISRKINSGENALIAEIKKASPSKGLIRANFDPVAIANSYKNGAATCLSILTDEPYFQGKNEYVTQVAKSCDLPILRKDFMLDPYQVAEARAMGADCILIIIAALKLDQAIELEEKAISLGLDVLIEVHNEEELEQGLKLKSKLLGINNRNLKTLEIDLATTERLSKLVPDNRILVCESGIYSNNDIKRMNDININTFLVGESLMKQDDITLATKKLLNKQ